jgi:cytochrome c
LSLVRILPIGCVLAVLASLALARVHPFGYAGLYAANVEAPLLNNSTMPKDVRAVLTNKCADCHSNQTKAPLYSHFAPASWLMERDILQARNAMNLSLWNSYSADQRQVFASKIVAEAKSQRMPPVQYRVIHWKAHIDAADLTAFGRWARESNPMQTDSGIAADGDPARGRDLFEKRCTGCHALTQNREGPKLQGVFGRTSGMAAGFAYSAALKKSPVVWDENSLEKWLTDPDSFIPGNEMDFLVSKIQERKDLIAYLRQTSSK